MGKRRDAPSRAPTVARVSAGIAVVGVLVGVLGFAVPLIVAAGDRMTTEDTIDVDTQVSSDDGAGYEPGDEPEPEPGQVIEPVAEGLSTSVGGASSAAWPVSTDWFAVPTDAPWSELWARPEACVSEGAYGWLKEHGVPIPTSGIMSEITNSATTGSFVTIRDIRAQGRLNVPTVETVAVGVKRCVGEVVEGVYATLDLGVDPVAVYDSCYSPEAQWSCAGAAGVIPIPGDPVVFDVAPGKTRTLLLSWSQSVDFEGRFVATASVGESTWTIDLSPSGETILAPAVTRPDDRLYFDDDETWCEADSVRQEACDLDSWLALLADG